MIRFDAPAAALANHVCGLWSWPGANCRFVSHDGKRDERVTIARAICYEGRGSGGEPGAISDVMSVAAMEGDLMILEIKPAGGRLMAWQDFVNGRRVQPGDRFVPIEPGE
jgi:methionyl-tRNA formyltransferase